jgi:hypothetical protein
MTLRSLEERLRHLPQPQVPKALKARLFATIPDTQPQIVGAGQIKWHFRIRNFGATAAAAVLIFAFMFTVNRALSIPPQALLTELEDVSLWHTGQQYYMYDQNDAPLVVTSLPDMQRFINPNEIGY